MQAAAFYRFEEMPPQLVHAVLNSEKVDSKKRIEFLSGSLKYAPSCFNDTYFFTYCIDQLQNNSKESGSHEELREWLQFVIRMNFTSALAEYRGWLTAVSDPYPPHVIVEVVANRTHFQRIMPRIYKQIQEELTMNKHVPLSFYVMQKDFIIWCAEKMADPDAKFLSKKNFKHLWENRDWLKHPEIKSALIAYASRVENRDAVFKLWPYGALPETLADNLL